MNKTYPTDLMHALSTGGECWAPIHDGAHIFTIEQTGEPPVDVWVTMAPRCLGWIVQNSMMRKTHPIELEQTKIEAMIASKQFRTVGIRPHVVM